MLSTLSERSANVQLGRYASIDLTKSGSMPEFGLPNFVARDMIAVQLRPVSAGGCRHTCVLCGAWTARSPQELIQHECVCYRFPTARTVYRWQFQRKGREFSLDPPGAIVTNDHLAMIALAKRGLGLAYADLVIAREFASGELEAVLARYLPTKPGLFLYFPTRSQTQPNSGHSST
jgi:DNA-binding transcriptional LysR family regulator